MIAPLLAIYSLCVFALLMGELREQRSVQYIFKPLASLAFVTLAYLIGAFDSIYGVLILAALIASLLGDLCLLKPGRSKLFLAGMASFAAAHVLYIVALSRWGFEMWWLLMIVPSTVIGLAAFKMMRPNIPKNLQIPTAMYSVIIALMGGFAILATLKSGHGIFAIAAGCFIVSDIFVSRHRFTPLADQNVLKGPRNYLLITPLYFFAQALFALTVGLV